jgi:hypothetical protein
LQPLSSPSPAEAPELTFDIQAHLNSMMLNKRKISAVTPRGSGQLFDLFLVDLFVPKIKLREREREVILPSTGMIKQTNVPSSVQTLNRSVIQSPNLPR